MAMNADQQHTQVKGPPLLTIVLQDILQLSEVMCIAQETLTVIALVASPTIMNGLALELGQNPHLINGNPTPFGMNQVIGQPVSSCHMQPPQLLIDTQPSFIKVNHLSSLNRLLNRLFNQVLLPHSTALACCTRCLLRRPSRSSRSRGCRCDAGATAAPPSSKPSFL